MYKVFKMSAFCLILVISTVPVSADARFKECNNDLSEKPYKHWLDSQVMYLFYSYGARELGKGFGVYNGTVGLLGNIKLYCSSDVQTFFIGTEIISLYNIGNDHKDNEQDKNNVFITNYLAWNLLHLLTEGKHLFGISGTEINKKLNIIPLNDGALLKFRYRF